MTEKELAGRLRDLLHRKCMTAAAVARKAGIDVQKFQYMLHGRKIIRAAYLPDIAKAMGVSIQELFEDIE